MKKTLLIYISIFCSFFIFSQKKDKIETIEMKLSYNNTTYIGTYNGNVDKVKKTLIPQGYGSFKGYIEGSGERREILNEEFDKKEYNYNNYISVSYNTKPTVFSIKSTEFNDFKIESSVAIKRSDLYENGGCILRFKTNGNADFLILKLLQFKEPSYNSATASLIDKSAYLAAKSAFHNVILSGKIGGEEFEHKMKASINDYSSKYISLKIIKTALKLEIQVNNFIIDKIDLPNDFAFNEIVLDREGVNHDVFYDFIRVSNLEHKNSQMLKYKGMWKEAYFNGSGTLQIADSTFTGNFIDSKIIGQGSASWKDYNYEGEFQNGKGNGLGKVKTNSYNYDGAISNYLANGNGKIVFFGNIIKDGILGSERQIIPFYVGEFRNGNMYGKGTLKYANGDSLSGNWNGLNFTGIGKLTLFDGSIYSGDWVNGKKQGKGKLKFPDGIELNGDFKDDLFYGIGKLKIQFGAIYEGEIVANKPFGKGKVTFSNGDFIMVNWNEQGFIGKGKRLASNGSFWDGEWNEYGPINKGKVTFKEGNIYEGEWTSLKEGDATYWVIRGKGKMLYPNIGTYEGDFANGIKEGPGDFKYLNGDTYSGDFKNDVKSGYGEMSYKNGTSYSGQWTNDLPNGQGEFKQTDGKVLSGKFVNGVFQKPFICKEVEIGNQVWMAENLTVAKFRNGDVIPQAKTMEEWKLAANKNQPIWCYYDFIDANGLKYGKLYNWHAVNDSRGLAPTGWRIPNPSDFEEMKAFSPENRSYLKDAENPYFISNNNDMLDKIISDIKSKTGWDKNGTNASGFNALPAGFLEFSHVLRKGAFYSKGESTYFWTSVCCTSFDSSASALQLNKYTSNIGGNQPKENCYSVRCIKE
jgi:uncharacterized protein (TIGR02145 family)